MALSDSYNIVLNTSMLIGKTKEILNFVLIVKAPTPFTIIICIRKITEKHETSQNSSDS